MQKFIIAMFLLILGSFSFAKDINFELTLDKVSFTLSAEDWVVTDTALLNINSNFALKNADLAKTRDTIMHNLNNLSKSKWHIVSFDRSQDSSGLETLFVNAQARVTQDDLKNIYQKAKDISTPGSTYTVSSIRFTPSFEDIQSVNAKLRSKLYEKVQAEIDRLNKVYTKQNFTLYRLSFQDMQNTTPQALKAIQMLNTAPRAKTGSVDVSDKVVLTAIAVVAANRDEEK